MEIILLLVSLLIKTLFFRMQPSTDFEVHRNWKDITTTSNIGLWYFDERSKWTLDYPPLFAYLEYLLGILADFLDKYFLTGINIHTKNNRSLNLIYYQRITVLLLGDITLYLSLKYFTNSFKKSINKYYLFFNLLMSGGLIIVDNIHFQYNTFLYGIFIFSVASMLRENYLLSSLLFTIVLLFKHIFLYFAPAYFFFLISVYVLKGNGIFHKISRLLSLILVVSTVFIMTLLPFIIECGKFEDSTLPFKQILTRLFPVSRGLLHSYWAPNFWALYTFIDKILAFVLLGKGKNTSTLGNVGTFEFDYLPQITPLVSNILVITLLLIYFIKNFNSKKPNFMKMLFVSSFIFFNFSYHVHEKAILMLSIVLLLWCYNISITNENEEETVYPFGLFYNTEAQLLMTCSFELELTSFFTQLPLIHDQKDIFMKLSLIVFILFFKFSVLKNTVSKNLKYKSTFYKWIIYYYIIASIIFDAFYMWIIPNLKKISDDEIAQTYMHYLKYFGRVDFKEHITQILIIKSIIVKYEYIPLMLTSVMNSCFVQLNSIKILYYMS